VNINVESFTINTTPTVDEDDLPDGSSPDAGALAVDGNLGLDGEDLISIDYGADGPAPGAPSGIGYGEMDFTITGPEGLMSQGAEVEYDNSTPGELTATADGREVFTVSLNDDGTFTFTLKDTIDHQNGQGQNTQLLSFGLLGVPAAALVTDFDFDPAALDGMSFSHSFDVNVIDDVPSAVNDDSLTVTEGDGAVSGNVMTNDTEGADGATLTSFTYNDADGVEQTALAGETVETETGTLTVNEDGSYSFQVNESVVHDTDGQTESESFTYTLTDADGDTAEATATIDILDTNPEVDAIAAPADGLEDKWIQLNMDSALISTEGPENLTITITGVPEGARLNPGTEVEPGVWTATAEELPLVCILPPQDFSGEIHLTLTVSTTDVDGDTDTDTETFTVFVAPDVDDIELTTEDATATFVAKDGSTGDDDQPTGGENQTGTDGDDTLIGGAGDDTITGLGGDDLIDGKAGEDTLIGDGGSTSEGGIVTVGEPEVIFQSSFETIPGNAQQQSDSLQAPEIDGWKSTGEGVEIWQDTAERDLGDQPDGTTTAADGDNFVELNNVPSDTFVDSDGIYRDVQTEAGKVYELTFSYSGRPGYDETVNKMAVSVDGDQLGEYSHDMESETDHDWQTVTVRFTGTGEPMRIEFSETSDNDDANGRGMSLDNIILTDTGTMEVDATGKNFDDTIYGGADDDQIFGNQGDDVLYGDDPNAGPADGCFVAPVVIEAADTDIDGSEEVLTIEIGSIPEGATLTNAAGDEFSGSTVHVLTPDQLEGLQIEVPIGTPTFSLDVEVTVLDTDPDRGTTDTDTKSDSLTITVPDEVPGAPGDPGDDLIVGGAGDDTAFGNEGDDIIYGDNAGTTTNNVYTYSVDNPPGSDNGGDIKSLETSFNETTNNFSFTITVSDPSNGKTNEGFTLAVNDGPNPKGNGDEMALFYFDNSGEEPVVSAYNYNGQNDFSSYNDTPLASSLRDDSPFTNVTSSIDEDGNHVYTFEMDATSIVEHSDGSDWTGVSFDENVGMWLHPMADINSDYGDDGYLDSWSIGSQGWFDTANQTAELEVVEVPKEDIECVEHCIFTYDVDNPPGSDNGGDIQNVNTVFNETTCEFTFTMVIEDVAGSGMTNGFTLAVNDGPNPKGNGDEMALFYFDNSGEEPVVSAYNYNGQNNFSSYNDTQLASSLRDDSPFTNVESSIDENGNHVFTFTMDATSIIEHSDGDDWTGVSFDENVGMWLHPMADVESTYGDDGYLDSWSIGSQGWFDTANQEAVKEIIEVPVASADYLVGNDGADQIHGEQGNDVIFGDNDDGSAVEDPALAGDTITGGSGDDTIFGQQGDDVIYGDLGPNMTDPNAGTGTGSGSGDPEPQEPVEVTFTLGDPSYSDDPLDEFGHNGDGYANGQIVGDDMVVSIGGLDDHDICDMSGGFTTNFTVDSDASGTTVTFDYRMIMGENYESNEFGEVWVAIDGQRIEFNGNDYVTKVSGDGNGGNEYDSGWQTVTIDVGDLPAGEHSITLGGYNNLKTYHDEELEVRFTDLQVTGTVGGDTGGEEPSGGADVNAIFHFELEDTTWGSNETVTDSVNGLTGTAKGGTGNATGSEGDGAQFDGSGDYIEVAHTPTMENTSGTFTMDFSRWNKGTLASKDSSGYDDGGHFDIDLTSGEVKVRFQTDGESFELKGGDVEYDQWTNVTVTWDGNDVTLYVDGEAVDSEESDWNMSANHNPWTFGASQVKSDDNVANKLEDYLNGQIDNPALFDGALSAAEVAAMVDGGVTSFVQSLGGEDQGGDTGGDEPADTAKPLSYNDDIHGGTGNDQIHGQYGNDVLKGGAGDDLITGGAGSDWIMGGSDSGTASNEPGAITVTFQGTDAGYSNTVGYYVLDDEGTPQSGEVIWANLHQTDVGSTHTIILDGFDQDDVGFFLIPDGGDLNDGLADGATVTFGESVDGSITVYSDGEALQGQDANAYFSNPDELNPDGVPHAQSTPITDAVGVTINSDGNDSYFQAQPTGMSGQQMTVEVGFKSDQLGNDFTPIMSYSAGRNGGNEFLVGASNGVLTVLIAGVSVATNILASGLFDGEEHMVSVSWDGSDGGLNVYVDGVSEFSTTGVATGESIQGGGTLIFGQEQDTNGGGFDSSQTFSGSYTHARIFDDVRDGVEVAQNAGEPLPDDEQNVVAEYNFGSYSNGSVSDSSGNGNDLTFQRVDGFDAASDPTILVGSSGETLLGFEDLLNGGDQDYNDAILSVKPMPSSADFQSGDHLWGGEEGGSGDGEKDAFFYARGDGVDTIHDFEMGTDQLFISGYERDEMTVLKDGDDTIISLGDGGAIKLVGVDADLFGSEDNIATHDADTDGSGALNIDELMELKDDVMPSDGSESTTPAADDAGIVMVAPVEPGLTDSGGNEDPQNG